ncbi:TPA: hypothetical protein ACPSKE_002235 [Legionella feeleii]|uniref:Yip1 domain-containing protein n=1 Tax=Legionella feeleii TaxID=453 RepID=A0A0W0TIC5_9GAMM|nr:hypothetical protein [Legionella feeleii]KTC95359.1 hypothetical protein Lfee_3024 [Legionella feeleii]SPX61104.1 Uncharacterised protein [Legionella feeleii]STX37983.1 Uncharacterised protein [Legionella feeleii]
MWDMLFKRYWRVCIFKETPANTPYSHFLLGLVSFLFLALIILQWYITDVQKEFKLITSIFAGLSLLCSYFIYTFVLLKVYRKTNRFAQTLTALLVSHLIVHIFAMPLLLVAPIFNSTINPTFVLFFGILYLILTLVLTVWQFLITAHIYKHALEVDNLASILASVGLLACNILTVSFW